MLIAIDPGKNGGIAWREYNEDLEHLVMRVVKMPLTATELVHFLNDLRGDGPPLTVVVEKAGFLTSRVAPRTILPLARMCGWVEGVVKAQKHEYIEVPVKTWRGAFPELPAHSDSGRQQALRKAEIKRRMEGRFPAIRVTNWNAEALALWVWAEDNGMVMED